MAQKTFAMIKPDAVKAGYTGNIIDIVEANGFTIAAMKKLTLSRAQAERFYAVHKARPFFGELVDFMISGPTVIMVLEKENAIGDWRTLMGATNPKEAGLNTIRKLYGANIGENATHGSDSEQTAQEEVAIAQEWL
jgi:nucleoside-diphosphate kinase